MADLTKENDITHGVTRLNKFKLRYNMFHDNYKQQVELKLGQIYTAFRELKLDVQLHHSTNVYKQVINKISQVYSFGVQREFDNEAHAELYESLRIDKTMAQANTYVNAFNDVLLQVAYDEVEGLKLVLRLPHRTEVEYEGGKLISVKYFVENLDNKTERWAYWSNEEHYYLDKTGGAEIPVPVDGNEESINPFGVLPFVPMHNGWRDEQFYDMYTGDDIVNGTIELCVHLTFLNHLIKTQSFKQLVGSGDNITGLSGQLSDPLSILTLSGQNTEISVLDLQANYEQLHKVINDLAANMATAYGISPSQFTMSGVPSSGFALQMENLELDKFITTQQSDFKYYENELYKLIKLVLSAYEGDQSGEMAINFIEPAYPLSRAEKLDNNAKAIDLGLISASQILEKEGYTPEEAQAIVANNIEERNKLYDKVNGSSLPPVSSALGL